MLEQALAAARLGRIRSMLLVTVNPLRESESAAAGDLSNVNRIILIGAISQAKHRLLLPD